MRTTQTVTPPSIPETSPDATPYQAQARQTPRGFFIRAMRDHPFLAGGIFVGDMLQAVFTLMIPFAVRDIVDTIHGYTPDNAMAMSLNDALTGPFFHFILITVAAALCARFSGLTLVFLAPRIRVRPRLRLVDYLQGHSINYFQSSHSGALGNKINDACNGLANGLWIFVFDVWPIMTKLVFSVFLLYVADPRLAVTLVCWAGLYFAVMGSIAIAQSRMMEKLAHERSRITGQVVDLATNIQTVKSYAGEAYEKERLLAIMEDERKAHYRFQFVREGGGIFHSVMSVAIMVLLMKQMLSIYEEGAMTLGDLAYVFSILLIVTEQARGLTWGIMNFLEFIGQMRDGVKTIMKPRTLLDRPGAQIMPPLRDTSIALQNVSFTYPEAKDKTVFDGLDLHIPAGQKIGLIGPSGAGKSTLVSLIMRFYDIDSGRILIGGHDIADVRQDTLRTHIAVIPQDTSLFHRSLADNIRYGRPDAPFEAIVAAAKQAHAHDFITSLPGGYDTMVGERGVRLSGGQRQRIAIARAILKDAPILVLDEATSALDSESERAIQDSLQTLMQGKTVIAIAHRLSTIRTMDRLIVMDGGRIIEDGTHDDLLARDGLYSRLWAMQSGGFLLDGSNPDDNKGENI